MHKAIGSYSNLLGQLNPHSIAENYMKDKLLKHIGVLNALQERKAYIKEYQKKLELRKLKNEKLSSGATLDQTTVFELNNELEVLKNEIDLTKKTILNQNENIGKEL